SGFRASAECPPGARRLRVPPAVEACQEARDLVQRCDQEARVLIGFGQPGSTRAGARAEEPVEARIAAGAQRMPARLADETARVPRHDVRAFGLRRAQQLEAELQQLVMELRRAEAARSDSPCAHGNAPAARTLDKDYSLWWRFAQSPCLRAMDDGDWLRVEFGRLLKDLREERGLSQAQLALDSGLDQTFVSLLERGRRPPSLISVLAPCDALAVEPDVLVRRLMAARPRKRR